jgi:hypothetical protein
MFSIDQVRNAISLLASFAVASGGFAWAFRAMQKRKEARAADTIERENAVTKREQAIADRLEKSNVDLIRELVGVRKELYEERLLRERDAAQIRALTEQIESMKLEIKQLRAQVEAKNNAH